MKKHFLLIIIISGIYSPLFSQNDFFPLSVGNYFNYQYLSVEKEYYSILPFLVTQDSGTVKYEVISVTDKDSTFEWTITETDSLIRSIDTVGNEIGIDTVFDISSTHIGVLIQRKESLNKITFDPISEIWASPTYWGLPYYWNLNGESLYRYSYEDSLLFLNQYYVYDDCICLDSLSFVKNIGLINAKSKLSCVSMTPYHYDWSATLMNYNVITEVKDIDAITDFWLSNSYPNPFNLITQIEYSISKNTYVTLKIFDILGKEIKTLVNQEKPIGKYKVEFDGKNLSSGVYFYRMETSSFSLTKKFILLK